MSLKILGSETPPSFAEKNSSKDFLLKNMYSILVVTVTGKSYSKSQVISSLQYFYCYIYHFHLQLRCFTTLVFRFPFRLLFSGFFCSDRRGSRCTNSLLVSGSEISHPTLLHHELPPFEKNELLRFWFLESVKKKTSHLRHGTWGRKKKKQQTKGKLPTNKMVGRNVVLPKMDVAFYQNSFGTWKRNGTISG